MQCWQGDVREALATAGEIASGRIRSGALVDTARMRAREGDIAEAAQAIALALQAAEEIGDGVERAQAFVDIAGVQLCAIEGGAH